MAADGTADDDVPDTRLSDPMPGGDDYYDEIDESILESLIIVALVGTLAFLVYYRAQRAQNARRTGDQPQQQQQGGGVPRVGAAPLLPGQQPDGGFFPPRGDPNFGQWVAGGVGH